MNPDFTLNTTDTKHTDERGPFRVHVVRGTWQAADSFSTTIAAEISFIDRSIHKPLQMTSEAVFFHQTDERARRESCVMVRADVLDIAKELLAAVRERAGCVADGRVRDIEWAETMERAKEREEKHGR